MHVLLLFLVAKFTDGLTKKSTLRSKLLQRRLKRGVVDNKLAATSLLLLTSAEVWSYLVRDHAHENRITKNKAG